MPKKTIEVDYGTPTTRDVPASEKAFSQPIPPPSSGEVGGRDIYKRIVYCPYCDYPSWIWYDTNRYKVYTCCHCYNDFEA